MSKKPNSVPEKFWPKELIIPSASEFHHGEWMINSGADGGFQCDITIDGEGTLSAAFLSTDLSKISDEAREMLRYECRTKCCLVGFAALAFNESGCTPGQINNPATVEFLDKFIELATGKTAHQHMGIAGSAADYDKPSFRYDVATLASNIFEGFEGFESPYSDKELSPRRANELWKKTARHFGYNI